MDRLKRISIILDLLRNNQLNTQEIKSILFKKDKTISLRQIQRDLNDIKLFINQDENISVSKENRIVYYTIIKQPSYTSNFIKPNSIISPTNFYKQIISEDIQKRIDNITVSIINSKAIIIKEIHNDETGDNTDFETKPFKFYPTKIIYHRDTYYLGGWNPQKKTAQIFGINQLKKIESTEQNFLISKFSKHFDTEFDNRFGVTKNINKEVYDIKLEMSPVLAGFIKTHYWHHSQKFSKKNHNIVMHLRCGINRELMGWLFQWMYNIRIIEPVELIDFYQKTINEIQKNVNSNKILMYKNQFEFKDEL